MMINILLFRYIFWNAGGLGWSIGKKDYLKSGSHWHRSKVFFVKSGLFCQVLFCFENMQIRNLNICLQNMYC